ncbi:unnamed protein product [Lactuca saligna]|uniref:Uncharacterized protein n=1 Tax=Lactuca saligna TaxID=75948 RepID=A0AA35ZAQ5_LACSI|nr:unnamed protein product [Lactuca saligna]
MKVGDGNGEGNNDTIDLGHDDDNNGDGEYKRKSDESVERSSSETGSSDELIADPFTLLEMRDKVDKLRNETLDEEAQNDDAQLVSTELPFIGKVLSDEEKAKWLSWPSTMSTFINKKHP